MSGKNYDEVSEDEAVKLLAETQACSEYFKDYSKHMSDGVWFRTEKGRYTQSLKVDDKIDYPKADIHLHYVFIPAKMGDDADYLDGIKKFCQKYKLREPESVDLEVEEDDIDKILNLIF